MAVAPRDGEDGARHFAGQRNLPNVRARCRVPRCSMFVIFSRARAILRAQRGAGDIRWPLWSEWPSAESVVMFTADPVPTVVTTS